MLISVDITILAAVDLATTSLFRYNIDKDEWLYVCGNSSSVKREDWVLQKVAKLSHDPGCIFSCSLREEAAYLDNSLTTFCNISKFSNL